MESTHQRALKCANIPPHGAPLPPPPSQAFIAELAPTAAQKGWVAGVNSKFIDMTLKQVRGGRGTLLSASLPPTPRTRPPTPPAGP